MTLKIAHASIPNFEKTRTKYSEGTTTLSTRFSIGIVERAPTSQVIFSFSAVIIEHDLLAVEFADEYRGRWRDQK